MAEKYATDWNKTTYQKLRFSVSSHSCANKHLLQGQQGALILATHVSRHDGPLVAAILYSTMRIRPTVHSDEYYNWAQFLPMYVASAIPISSPKSWSDARRTARKLSTLDIIHKVLANGNSILLFPAGGVRKQEREVIQPYLSGVYDILWAEPDTPVMLLKIDGLGRFQFAIYDLFWSFLGIKKGRRHVSVNISSLVDLDTDMDLASFHKHLETRLNA